jgi:integrase
MPSFRSAKAQAQHCVRQSTAIGDSKPASGSVFVHSLGTQRTYAVSLRLFATWLREKRLDTDMRTVGSDIVAQWLYERSEQIGQKCLDNDRQAVSKVLGFEFPRIRSNYEAERDLADESRAYVPKQVDLIVALQSPRNAFSTRVAQAAGLRAQELHTLRPVAERAASDARDWSPQRFLGMAGCRYTVDGKGGLVREVMLPEAVAAQLETRRRKHPITVRDREINYASYYDVAGGNAWSKSFTVASEKALGYSTGAHGLRHGYAQERLADLQQAGLAYDSALRIVSQELGHFRPDVTEIYLR